MPKTSRPLAVVVSMEAPRAGEDLQPHSAFRKIVHERDEVLEVPPQPVELPHRERVAPA